MSFKYTGFLLFCLIFISSFLLLLINLLYWFIVSISVLVRLDVFILGGLIQSKNQTLTNIFYCFTIDITNTNVSITTLHFEWIKSEWELKTWLTYMDVHRKFIIGFPNTFFLSKNISDLQRKVSVFSVFTKS